MRLATADEEVSVLPRQVQGRRMAGKPVRRSGGIQGEGDVVDDGRARARWEWYPNWGHKVEQALSRLRAMQLLNRRATEDSHRQCDEWSEPLDVNCRAVLGCSFTVHVKQLHPTFTTTHIQLSRASYAYGAPLVHTTHHDIQYGFADRSRRLEYS